MIPLPSLRPTSATRIILSVFLAIFIIFTVSYVKPPSPLSPQIRAPGHLRPVYPDGDGGGNAEGESNGLPGGTRTAVSEGMLSGEVISGKLGNETVKAELGRSTWRFFHTMMAQYPENPTEDEQETLRSFIYLFTRLYPCGECASHFQSHLAKYPPQVSSRSAAAGWACFIHNEVNQMLNKEIFDCNNIGDFYDCGCGHDDDDESEGKGGDETEDEGTGDTKKVEETVFEPTRVEISDEPPTNG